MGNITGVVDRAILNHIMKQTSEYLKILQEWQHVQSLSIDERKTFINIEKAVDAFGYFIYLTLNEKNDVNGKRKDSEREG